MEFGDWGMGTWIFWVMPDLYHVPAFVGLLGFCQTGDDWSRARPRDRFDRA